MRSPCTLLHTGLQYKAGLWLRECCRQVEAEVLSNSRNKIHQTWCLPYTRALYNSFDNGQYIFSVHESILGVYDTTEGATRQENVRVEKGKALLPSFVSPMALKSARKVSFHYVETSNKPELRLISI